MAQAEMREVKRPPAPLPGLSPSLRHVRGRRLLCSKACLAALDIPPSHEPVAIAPARDYRRIEYKRRPDRDSAPPAPPGVIEPFGPPDHPRKYPTRLPPDHAHRRPLQ